MIKNFKANVHAETSFDTIFKKELDYEQVNKKSLEVPNAQDKSQFLKLQSDRRESFKQARNKIQGFTNIQSLKEKNTENQTHGKGKETPNQQYKNQRTSYTKK